MMSRHFRLRSELSGSIAKRLPRAKNQLSAPGSFFNQFVKDELLKVDKSMKIVTLLLSILLKNFRM